MSPVGKEAVFVMGASGKLGKRVSIALASDYELILQCNRRCVELSKYLRENLSVELLNNVHIVRHDFLKEGVSSLTSKISEVVNELKAAVLIHPVFNQTPTHELRDEVVEKVVKLNLITPLLILKELLRFMRGGDSIVVFLTDLTPIKGSKAYLGLKPSLPNIASVAGIHAVIKNSVNYVPENVRVVGLALNWVDTEALTPDLRKALSDAGVKLINPNDLAGFIKQLIRNSPRELRSVVIEFGCV